MRILCSTGSVLGRSNNDDHTLLAGLARRLECDGFEFLMDSSLTLKIPQVIEYLHDNNIKTPVLHCRKHIGEYIARGSVKNLVKDPVSPIDSEGGLEDGIALFQTNVAIAKEIGAEKIVLHLWNGEISDSRFNNNLEAYAELRAIADDAGIDLLIENVVCNCGSPLRHWCELADRYPDVHFIFDTKMAAFHGELELLYSDEYAWLWKEGHIRHYHLNDYGGVPGDWSRLRPTLPIGSGNIDFERLLAFIRSTGYDDSVTLESTAIDRTGLIHEDMIIEQARLLKAAFSKPAV